MRFRPELSKIPLLLLLGVETACTAGPSDGPTTDGGTPSSSEAGTDAAPANDSGGERTPEAAPEAGDDSGTPVVTVPLSGCSFYEYSVPVEIGSQTFPLFFDTGSTTVGVASAACAECADAGISPLYVPGSTATDEHQATTSQFNGESWQGELYQDTLGVANLKTRLDFVAIDTESNFFLSGLPCGSGAGVIGFARPAAAIPGTTGFFDTLVGAGAVADVFAAQFCDVGGTLWIGGYDPAALAGPLQYTPLLTSGPVGNQFDLVDFETVSVEGVSVAVPTGGYTQTVVDTGNNAFFLPPDAFTAIVSEITSNATFQELIGAAAANAAWFSFNNASCPTLTQTKAELDATLPPLRLVFGTGADAFTVTATATESYLVPAGGGVWCPGLFEWTPAQEFPFAAILGTPVLRSRVVVFDRQNGRFGMAPHQPCP